MKQGQRDGRGGRGGQDNKKMAERDKQKDLRLTGVVRSVVSGDTLLIMEVSDNKAKANTQPNNFYLTLMGLKAPALGKRQKKDGKLVPVPDEPFAYQSREFLRQQVIGKLVVYRVEHELETRAGEQYKRKFGEVWLTQGETTVNLRQKIVEAGWARATVKEWKPKEGKEPPKPRQSDEELLAAQSNAEAKKLGLFSDDKKFAVRKIKYRDDAASPDDQYAFFEKMKGKTHTAVVEQVRTGSLLRLYLPDTQDEISVNLSGIRCPTYVYNDLFKTEEFALEAKMFTESKLWHRTVSVTLDGLDKSNFFGTVTFGEKKLNIALALLELGLATIVEWSASNKNELPAWKEVEGKAKAAKLRLWKGHSGVSKQDDGKQSTQKSLTGQVVEVVNAGSIVVRISKEKGRVDDYKLHFSSVKVPPLPNKKANKDNKGKPQEEQKNNNRPLSKKEIEKIEADKLKTPQEREAEAKQKAAEAEVASAWAVDAREWLRKTLIGKTVSCVWDYPVKQKAGDWKQYHSIYLGQQNIGLKLVELGYANVQGHLEDDPRSPEWKDMVLAERAAAAAGLRLHGLRSKGAPLHHLKVNDLTNNEYYPKVNAKKERIEKGEATTPKPDPLRNKPFADELKKQKGLPAVVDYVVSASRFKVYLPKQNYVLTLSLSAIKSDPKEKVGDDKSNEHNPSKTYPVLRNGQPCIGNIAYHTSRDTLFQRDVFVDVEGTDTGGAFVGRVYIQQGNELVDWGLKLLHEGLVSLSDFAPKIITEKKLLARYESAQAEAQKLERGKWVGYDHEAELAKKQAAEEAYKNRNKKDFSESDVGTPDQNIVTVTEIMSGSNFFYQVSSPNTENALKELEAAFASENFDALPVYTPKEIDPKEKDRKNERVAGKFTVDGNWYRADIIRVIKPKDKNAAPQYELRYVDYGNTEVVGPENIRKLPEALAKVNNGNALAQKARLAYITAPDLDDDFGRDAAAFFKELVWGRPMRANIQRDRRFDDGVKQLTLGDEDGTHINGLLVKEGLARVDKYGPKSKEGGKKTEFEILKDFQEEAKKSRYNIWQYGELPDSDDERAFANQLR